jgi:hypothetical protein
LCHHVDLRDPHLAAHPNELEAFLTDQLDSNRRDSSHLSTLSSDYYGDCDSGSCSSDGDGCQYDDGDCDSGSSSSSGDGGHPDTNSGAGSSDDAAVAPRADAERPAGTDTERAQADAGKVEIQGACLQADRECLSLTASPAGRAPHPGYDSS